MKIIDVAASSPYRVEIGSGALELLPERLCALCTKAERIVVVTDDNVYPLHGERVLTMLREAGYAAEIYILPHGEAAKTAEILLALLHFLTEQGIARSDALAALGGGMIGDLTGFAAAVYMRGISYFQIPTTLLSAVDSSVGGKTAVDLPAGKNLMGAFWQPAAVLCDTELLKTLPEEIFADGCAEVIKTALLFDPALYECLSRSGPAFDREAVIARCVEHKRNVVAKDEFDRGLRALLNLGHTLGHAVEALSGFQLSHGKSVAVGMAVVCRAAAKAGYCDAWLPKDVCRVLQQFGLPTETSLSLDDLMGPMLSDKKRSGSRVNVVVPRRVGLSELVPMDAEGLRAFMKAGLTA